VIPALPILVPLGIVLMVVSAVVLRRRGELDPWRLGACWLAGWYAVAVLGATMLPLPLSWGAGDPELYRILWLPIATMRPDDFILNIAMMLPLAALLHVVFGVRDRRRVVRTGFAISAAVETVQLFLILFLHGNRWADTNDLIANTLGAWLGWLAFQRLLRHEGIRRVARRASPSESEKVVVDAGDR
jgi:glycopeptide antibiotics resistance protein